MKQLRFILLLLVLLSGTTYAQDIFIKVKIGGAAIGKENLKESSPAVILKSTDVISVLSEALVIARQDVIIVELTANKEYSHKDVLALIQKKKQAASGSFATVAFKDPIQKSNPSPLKGSSTRGSNSETSSIFFYPYDNMLVYDPKPKFIIGGVETRLTSNVVLKNIKTNKIYFDGKNESRDFEVSGLPEGDYEWSYSIEYYNKNSETIKETFTNTFSVPSKAKAKELSSKVAAFKKELKGFSPKMQEVLLVEYCTENNIYYKVD